MLPTKSNHTKDGCVATSSNCVIWQGPDIACINLCKGDTVSDIVAKLAIELCEVLDYVNLSAYDLSCLDLAVQPTTFDQLIQLIITRLCNAETAIDNIETGGSGGGGGGSSVCPDDCLINLPICLRYTNPSTGSLVTTTSLTDFIALLGNKFCELQTLQGQNTDAIEQIAEDLEALQVTVNLLEASSGALPPVNINCITGTNSTPLVTAVQTIATTLCSLETTVEGISGTEVTNAILSQCPGLNTSNSLTGAGTMQQLSGWVSNPLTIADSLTNLWLTVCDMRTAIQNVLTNCCTSICNGLSIQMEIGYNGLSNLIELTFTGNIPPGLTANPLTTQLSISQPGFGGQTINVPIQNYINGTSYTFTPSGGINTNSTFTITGVFNGQSSEDTCPFPITGIYTPTAECPVLTLTPNPTEISWLFTSTSPTTSYQVQLLNSTGATVLNVTSVNPTVGPITGSFPGLSSGTTYLIRIGYDVNGGARYTYCPSSTVTTNVLACIPANTADASISITFGG
jgi:hypothetical protein